MTTRPIHWRYFTVHDLEMDAQSIKRSFAQHIEYTQGKDEYSVSQLDFFQSLARSVRDRMLDRWNTTQQRYYQDDVKRVYYLSMEFLLGRLLRSNLVSLGILEPARQALAKVAVDLDAVLDVEEDMGLGNGGLGRLAACFLDSMATQGVPAYGCGIRYEYGIFKQVIDAQGQVEIPDNWLRYGCPWEIPRPERLFPIHLYGRVVSHEDASGRLLYRWVDTQTVMAMAYDVLVPGYRNGTVNTLRLWAAKASREFDFANFNRGDYLEAVYEKNATENISRVLYPNDATSQGRELRLKQEYFFVSASLQDALRRHLKKHPCPRNLHHKAVFQLNDTHPALAVAELMRLLIDEHGLDWDEAWAVSTRCFAYTNHTVMPEAMERWRVALLERVLPRILQIVFEINARFLAEVRAAFPGDEERVRRMSIIEEHPVRQVHMAHLAIVGSTSVNGVSRLHTRLLCERLFADFAQLWPERFTSKTNGITPRRWLLSCNPELSRLVDSRVGDGWPRHLHRLERLAPWAEDAEFRSAWREARRRNKARLARLIELECGVPVDPESLFDVQVKRIHQYKRQLMNVLHVLAIYRRLQRHGPGTAPARTVIFGGKAAPGYHQAKLIVRLIHDVARVVNGDPAVRDSLRVVFLPNYGVSQAEVIIPAADLSEQISTAGTEASGTGNMKFALNGALTIGTLDGANIEIMEAVGRENMFIFGLDEPGASALRAQGYDPRVPYESDPELRAVLDLIATGLPGHPDPGAFRPLLDILLHHGDPFLVLADFAAYRDCQLEVDRVFQDPDEWTRRSILNVARMGRFSSDVTIASYAREIWGVPTEAADAR